MRNKIIVGILGLALVVAGIAAFSAFTAQMVNLEAKVEKEIHLAPVICDPYPEFDENGNPNPVGPNPHACNEDTGDFGVLVPQREYDKFILLTVSQSFFDQDVYGNIRFDLYWECKQTDDTTETMIVDVDGVPLTVGKCRTTLDPTHDDFLDGRLRDYVTAVSALDAGGTTNNNQCLDQAPGGLSSTTPWWVDKDIERITQGGWQGAGFISKTSPKCLFEIKLLAPACKGSYNPFTDPLPPAETIDCREVRVDADGNPSDNPQDWDFFAFIGDEFKIQVVDHSTQ